MQQPTPEALRLIGKMTIEQLAETSGISRNTISRIELGKCSYFAPDTLDRIAQALGINLEAYVYAALSVRKAVRR